ncbi:MAG: aminotransferase class V-fold PLP-dependent enzyme [Bacteroidales bacterium]
MHPDDPMEKLDAIFFSPHKFLGGPGSAGVLVFDSALYNNEVPDNPGGGTVDWTNPWGEYKYVDDIEAREDGGTPGFLQVIRAALAIKLKEQMGTEMIRRREEEMVSYMLPELRKIPGLNILADNVDKRLGVISFYNTGIHYNLMVKLLSDLYGIQVRGGCACAGTYGHFLLDVSYDKSHNIVEKINSGDLSDKPGWVRLSLHPTMKESELEYFVKAVEYIVSNIEDLKKKYCYNSKKNEFMHCDDTGKAKKEVLGWFELK